MVAPVFRGYPVRSPKLFTRWKAVAGGLDHVVPMRAFGIDAVEDFGEVFRQELDLPAGFCDGPDRAGWRLEVVLRRWLRHGDGDISAVRLGIAQGCKRGALPGNLVVEHIEIEIEDFQVVGTLAMETFDQGLALVPVVEGLNGLFEADGDEDAEDDDEEVSEEFAARHGRVLRRMDVDHAGSVKSIPFRWAGSESFVSAA